MACGGCGKKKKHCCCNNNRGVAFNVSTVDANNNVTFSRQVTRGDFLIFKSSDDSIDIQGSDGSVVLDFTTSGGGGGSGSTGATGGTGATGNTGATGATGTTLNIGAVLDNTSIQTTLGPFAVNPLTLANSSTFGAYNNGITITGGNSVTITEAGIYNVSLINRLINNLPSIYVTALASLVYINNLPTYLGNEDSDINGPSARTLSTYGPLNLVVGDVVTVGLSYTVGGTAGDDVVVETVLTLQLAAQ